MKNKIYKALSVILICILLIGCTTATDNSYATIDKSGYFIVGYDPDNYHTFGGYGLAIDIIKTAANRMELQAPISPVTNSTWQTHLTNKTIDVMLCASSSEDMQSVDLFYDSIVLVKSKDKARTKIGIIDSSACIDQKNKLSFDMPYEYIYYSDAKLLLNDLDIMIIDSAIMSEYDALTYNDLSNYDVDYLSQMPVNFVVSSQSNTFFSQLNGVLSQMVNDGTINRLKLEYIQSLNSGLVD
ncbi:MAG: ABC transporter substrate-binding protein [Clostridiales bacterium]|nr:ABC transporter substrate-binding protein [Clostridiales bacterium]